MRAPKERVIVREIVPPATYEAGAVGPEVVPGIELGSSPALLALSVYAAVGPAAVVVEGCSDASASWRPLSAVLRLAGPGRYAARVEPALRYRLRVVAADAPVEMYGLLILQPARPATAPTFA